MAVERVVHYVSRNETAPIRPPWNITGKNLHMTGGNHNKAETPPVRIYPSLYPEKLHEHKEGLEKRSEEEEEEGPEALEEDWIETESKEERSEDPPPPGEGP